MTVVKKVQLKFLSVVNLKLVKQQLKLSL